MSRYFLIINFAKENTIIYFIILNFFIFLVIVSLVLSIITIIKIKNDNLISLVPIYILQFIIPFISSSFFGQIIYAFLTVFYCEENTNNSFFNSSYKCLR